MTILRQNLMSCIKHDREPKRLWTYYDRGKWHVTEKAPIEKGRDMYGRIEVEIEPAKTFRNVEFLLEYQRKNGYHSWK